MDGRRLIYEPLPADIRCSTLPLLADSDPFIKSYVRGLLPEADRGLVDESFQKTYSLVGLKAPKLRRHQHRRKGSLSLCERRRLGLYQLHRYGSNYRDAIPIHSLWQDYITTVLSLPDLLKSGFCAKPTDKIWEQVSMALYRADYHGAEIEVIRSKCNSLLGLKGIVLMETKNTFKIIGRDNIIRTVPKPSCAFSFSLMGIRFTIYGKYFCTVPAFRSTKKTKGQIVEDM